MLALKMDLLNGLLPLAQVVVMSAELAALKLQAKLLSQLVGTLRPAEKIQLQLVGTLRPAEKVQLQLVGTLRPTEKIQLRWVTVHQQRLTRQLTTEYKMFLIRQ